MIATIVKVDLFTNESGGVLDTFEAVSACALFLLFSDDVFGEFLFFLSTVWWCEPLFPTVASNKSDEVAPCNAKLLPIFEKKIPFNIAKCTALRTGVFFN